MRESQRDDSKQNPTALARGRAALSNHAGRFEPYSYVREADEWEEQAPDPFRREIIIDKTQAIIARNQSPDLPFDRAINPYRGCEHGCIYCYARPSHAYLGYSPGLDFETRILAKPDAPALLEKALRKPGYKPAPLSLGSNTDPYQPLEREMRITREILEVLRDFQHPVMIVTKGALALRDLDILAPMAQKDLVSIAFSITTLDHKLSRKMEPRASAPQKRLEAARIFAAEGVPVMAMAAPMIPAINDHELEAILEAARDAGASSAAYIALRLPLEVAPLFEEWLRAHFPARAKRVLNRIREMRGGALNQSDWTKRMTGEGVHARLLSQRYKKAAARLGLSMRGHSLRSDLFRRPLACKDQPSLFEI